jgi:hypothetical protein
MAANCSPAKGRGYAMNHDGSNPHFLGSDDAVDVEKRGRKAHAATEGHDCTWQVYMGNMILSGGEPSEYRAASKRVLPAGSLACVSVNEETEVDFKMCLQWRHVHHAPGEGYDAIAGQCQSVRSTVAALLVRPLAFGASCGTKIGGDVELHLGLRSVSTTARSRPTRRRRSPTAATCIRTTSAMASGCGACTGR